MGFDAFFHKGSQKNEADRERLIAEISDLKSQVESLKQAERSRQMVDDETVHLASFPEQYPNPIIEISSAVEIRYLNPAAKTEFPDLTKKGKAHSILKDMSQVIALLENSKERSTSRDIAIGEHLYRETIHYLPEKKTLRIFIKDITEQRRLEFAFKESEKRLRLITDSMMDVVSVTDITARYLYVSPSMEKVLGYKPEDMLGKSALMFMHPLDAPRVAAVIREHVSTGLPGRIVLRFRHADGHYVWLEAAGDMLYEDGKLTGAILSCRDISERKAAEEQVHNSLKEKEVLLKEIHHRVKNNLQIISSLLNLQSAYIKDERDLHIFRDCQNRVKSMALVHEKLYRSESLSKIDFGEYVRSLVGTLYKSYGIGQDQVRFEFNISDILLDVDTAIHCGLMVNEILSNSLKHAFPQGRKGKIWLEMKPDGDYVDMYIGDDGVGLPANMDINKTGTLGMQLVTSLVSQLGGTMDLDRNNGTRYHIRLKI